MEAASQVRAADASGRRAVSLPAKLKLHQRDAREDRAGSYHAGMVPRPGPQDIRIAARPVIGVAHRQRLDVGVDAFVEPGADTTVRERFRGLWHQPPA